MYSALSKSTVLYLPKLDYLSFKNSAYQDHDEKFR